MKIRNHRIYFLHFSLPVEILEASNVHFYSIGPLILAAWWKE